MKKLFYLSVVLFVFSSCSGSNNLGSNNLGQFGSMFGKVKKVKTMQYDCDMKFGEAVAGELEEVSIVEYDIKGNPIKNFTYDHYGDLEYGIVGQWDDDGIIPTREEHYGRRNENEPERITELISQDGDNYTFKSTDSDGKVDTYTVNIYEDDLYRKIKEEDGAIQEIWYNENGQLKSMKYYDKEWDAEQVNEYNDGMLISVVGHHQEVNFKYKYEYTEFDSRGNWLTATETRDGEVRSMMKREITYWD